MENGISQFIKEPNKLAESMEPLKKKLIIFHADGESIKLDTN